MIAYDTHFAFDFGKRALQCRPPRQGRLDVVAQRIGRFGIVFGTGGLIPRALIESLCLVHKSLGNRLKIVQFLLLFREFELMQTDQVRQTLHA